MEFLPYDRDAPTHRWQRYLPHWEQPGRTYFVTFRLADSIPKEKLEQWKNGRVDWEKVHSKPWSDSEWSEYRKQFLDRIENWSDRGYGACPLREMEQRKTVSDALQFFDGDRYELGDFVIMPNHVHLLVMPLEGWTLGKLIHSWKSFTANQINRLLGQSGKLWMEERFDHLVRNGKSLEKFRDYIANNPSKAGLKEDQYTLNLTGTST